MIEILGQMYLTDKEASARYGYSQRWFIKMRAVKRGPPYVQIEDNGRVLYPLDKVDEWFKERLKERE